MVSVATRIKQWTLEELHSLPEDGNKYEVVRGELFVTPPPSDQHETIAARLAGILTPYVEAHGLGHVYRPRAVMRFAGSEVEPDLMVRAAHPDRRGTDSDWTRAPIPLLVVEILSPYTRRRDREDKRPFYIDAGVDEYWMVDPEERSITIVRIDSERESASTVTWAPSGVSASLTFEVGHLFA
jgi:Uma2 family endonuclease